MPMLTREYLAHRFRQNWLAKHPVDMPNNLDDSLTSLNWLQNLNIMKIAAPTPPASPQPLLPSIENSMDLRVNPNAILNIGNVPQIKQEPGLMYRHPAHLIEVAPPMATSPSAMDKIDYKTNPSVKPPYSYATLICMAMRESKKNKITLAGIYNWITENFMYYRLAEPSWQNSIRHNLSLNKCFQKVPRRKDEPGKGGFWRINPEYSDMFVNGIFKKRRSSTRENVAPPAKKIKKEPEDPFFSNMLQFVNATAEATRSGRSEIQRLNSVGEDIDSEEAWKGADFSWNAILNQDIDVGGIRIKTEDIIDERDSVASPITSFSPPPSDSNSDIALEDLFNAELSVDADSLELPHDDALDLTISGIGLRPPDWWGDSLNGAFKQALSSPAHNSGLNTPISQSPVPERDHPWAEKKDMLEDAVNSFDVDIHNLFGLDSVPSPEVSDSL